MYIHVLCTIYKPVCSSKQRGVLFSIKWVWPTYASFKFMCVVQLKRGVLLNPPPPPPYRPGLHKMSTCSEQSAKFLSGCTLLHCPQLVGMLCLNPGYPLCSGEKMDRGNQDYSCINSKICVSPLISNLIQDITKEVPFNLLQCGLLLEVDTVIWFMFEFVH